MATTVKGGGASTQFSLIEGKRIKKGGAIGRATLMLEPKPKRLDEKQAVPKMLDDQWKRKVEKVTSHEAPDAKKRRLKDIEDQGLRLETNQAGMIDPTHQDACSSTASPQSKNNSTEYNSGGSLMCLDYDRQASPSARENISLQVYEIGDDSDAESLNDANEPIIEFIKLEIPETGDSFNPLN